MKKQLSVKEVVSLIKSNSNLVFIQDVIELLQINWSTFYKWFPKNSDDYQLIVDTLDGNKTVLKSQIRMKMLESGNATNLYNLYRLIATKQEIDSLNGITTGKDDNKTITLKIK